jgi:1,4-dihydroxy-2-naphthoate octaprenyltransferase
MALATRGLGLTAAARAYLSQVHPVFMLPPLAVSLFGAVLARSLDPWAATAHALAVFTAVYTAHLKDGYVDFYVRGEDDSHPLTPRGCWLGLAASTLVFAGCVGWLVLRLGPAVALVTTPMWVVGYFHAPQFDTHPVTATMGYPFGITLALLGGFYVQTGAITAETVGFAVIFLCLLSGIKVIDDTQDYAYDASIDKRTVAVWMGVSRAYQIAYGLMSVALAAVVALVASGLFPPTALFAAAAFALVSAFARRGTPELATMLLVRGSYVFLAVLVAAVWFEPLA